MNIQILKQLREQFILQQYFKGNIVSMCGICFILGGANIQDHKFQFNFFQSYLCKSNVPLNEHIIENKLMLPGSFEPSKIQRKLKNRGPDKLKIDLIDMFKINYKEMAPQNFGENHFVEKGQALGFQSVLHLRGKQMFLNTIPGAYFLFNGEIWSTGSLEPIDNYQNDTVWLHQKLIECKGSRDRMIQILQQIRGDFSFVYVEGDQIFIGKDYFGKRSLLLGMGEDYFIVTSAPMHDSKRILQQNQQNPDLINNQEQAQQSWKQKYEAEWLSSKNKYYFEIPANSLIQIDLLKDGRMKWGSSQIYKVNLLYVPKNMELTELAIIQTTKKLLIECLRELTHCIYKLGDPEKPQTKIAVLFSGGIDSTLIARILDFVLPKNQTIDLVNLAFRADAPDRDAGLASYKQLVNLSPQRKYNLILLDKKLQDVDEIKQQLMETIYPKSTHMDFNIAAALNLAVTGTKAKIILTGLGADQIFSGYSRYRIAFKRAGLEQLEKEMIFDMERIWIRNLGRDDRSIGNRGKQVRYPFLHLPLWTYLRSVNIERITEGAGQKLLLRKIARQFGLQLSSTFKKRAIQFGTRLAKLSNVKSFGSNRKAKGTSQYK